MKAEIELLRELARPLYRTVAMPCTFPTPSPDTHHAFNILHWYPPGYGLVWEADFVHEGMHEPWARIWLWDRFAHSDQLNIYWIAYPDPEDGSRQIKCAGEYVGDLTWHQGDEDEG